MDKKVENRRAVNDFSGELRTTYNELDMLVSETKSNISRCEKKFKSWEAEFDGLKTRFDIWERTFSGWNKKYKCLIGIICVLTLSSVLCLFCCYKMGQKISTYESSIERLNTELEKVSKMLPLDTTEFVEYLYDACFGDNKDVQGLRNWADNLSNGKLTAKGIVHKFFQDPQFTREPRSDKEFIEVAYKITQGEKINSVNLDPWLDKLEKAKTEEGDPREIVLNMMLDSDEFKKICEKYHVKVD